MIRKKEWSTKLWGLLGMLSVTTSASAHDQWANGKPIPDWVKQTCCAEGYQTIDERRVHRLMGPDPVTGKWGLLGYHVDGFYNVAPVEHRFDSEDGLTWIFYGLGAYILSVHERRLVRLLVLFDGRARRVGIKSADLMRNDQTSLKPRRGSA